MNMKSALKIILGSVTDWLKDAFCLQRLPGDRVLRRRMQACILGARAGSAMRPGPDGKVHIEVEDGPKSQPAKAEDAP